MEHLKIGDKEWYELRSPLWQMQDLVKVIHEKVDTNVFIDVEDCVFRLKKSLTNKKTALWKIKYLIITEPTLLFN